MLRTVGTLVCCTLLLAGCARLQESPVNPFNWGKNKNAEVAPENVRPLVPERKKVVTVDNRQMVGTVTSVSVQNVQGGIIVTAIGTPDVAGVYNVELVRVSQKEGVMVLAFRVQHPAKIVSGRAQSITAGHFVSNKDLAGISAIQVQARRNAISRRY